MSADATVSNWEDAKIEFTNLIVTVPLTNADPLISTGSFDSAFPSLGAVGSQRDTRQIRGGVEYRIDGEKVRVPVRAGAFLDRQMYVVDGEGLDGYGYTLGMGFHFRNRLFLDLALVRSFQTLELKNYDGVVYSDDIRDEGTRIYLSAIYRFGDKK